ncbi:PTS sugar transporter subunit IIA [Diaphorobacter aerolatus]|uniref:PTS sugar transporter subunit IIA n=1 Tax=Diaphorobacter aerolatus TaxID=1288495 RepID=A0A7H0GFM0_9BURK|nr:PTS sugar transporter subunit IIA [Diaphorobacter aerolatus]QNP47086.1 PTS sugar transporter subunit IIA [Diaphorobacter aerolatus]
MTTHILIIAHAPLAHALRECALHVFPECEEEVLALDVPPNETPETTQATAQVMLDQHPGPVLLLTDVFGATPCNVAQRLTDGQRVRLLCGVNLPMLLRAVCYRTEDLESLVSRAMVGGTQGVMQVAPTAPQNQARLSCSRNDQEKNHHQQ